jgi:hypothetical protein
MKRTKREQDPDRLVMTQAEKVPPPDVTVPEAPSDRPVDAATWKEVERLAARVGGAERLKAIVDELVRRTQ